MLTAILAHAEQESPNECCGLVAGAADWLARRHYPLPNALNSPVEFESEPRAMFAAIKDIRKCGWEVLAVYHSHPTTPPTPSRTDVARSYSDSVVNLIVSLQSIPPTVHGWWLNGRNVSEAEWDVVDD